MRAYKLFRVLKSGGISSLFINKKRRYNLNEWMQAEPHKTNGFAFRFGWHCTGEPTAPHLSMNDRKWYEVEIEGYENIKRPISQGGVWYLAQRMKIIKEV